MASNPILKLDYPDIDVIRVDDTYYMISTTMYFMPGGVILRSYDLVHWEIASYVFDAHEDTPAAHLMDGQNIYGQGMWAASLRYHNGIFYVCFVANDTKKTYLYQAKNIEGPWTKQYIEGFYHDCSLLFDDDSRVYIVYGNTDIYLTELKEDLTGPKEGGLSRLLVSDNRSKVGLGYEGSHIYKINGRQANLVWQYDANKALFSHQYGSVRETNYGYLMNFGYNLKDEYRNNALGLLSEAEANQDNIYAKIIEVDKNKNVLFEAISEEGKFRVFKNSMYKSVTSNPVISQLNIFENLEEDTLNEITYKEVDIENSSEWIYETNFTKNTFDTNYEILDSDELKLYFVNRNGKIYILDYKKKDSINNKRIFNVNLPKDEYALYINLNDKIYKTNNVYKF